MIVTRLEVAQFGRITASIAVDFSTPVTVIVGDNDSGKSSLIEAVANGVWGASVRGEDLAHVGVRSTTGVHTDGGVFLRGTYEHGTACCAWGPGDAEAPYRLTEMGAAAHKAKAVETHGTFDAWRTCHVFSAQGRRASFLASTDKEQKEVLESILSLGYVDAAAAAAKAARTKAEAEVRRTEDARRNAESRLQAWRAIRVQAQAPTPVPAASGTEVAEAESAMRDARRLLAEAERVHASATTTVRTLDAALANPDCPTCKRPLPQDRAALQAAHADAQQVLTRADAAVREARVAFEEDEAVYVAAQGRLNAYLKYQRELRDYEEGAAQDKATEDVMVDVLRDADADEQAAVAELGTCEAVVAAFGARGVRAYLLNNALGVLSVRASLWFQRLGGAGAIRVLQEGDKIKVLFTGYDTSYRGLASGYQRRADLAFLFAAGELGGASTGTIWFDEVFDSLDQGGRDLVAGVVDELAKTRPVVVITHRADIASALAVRGARTVTMSEGTLYG